jgi:hypothetical protein
MKKLTNKILLITLGIILIINVIFVTVLICKYNNNTLIEWVSER